MGVCGIYGFKVAKFKMTEDDFYRQPTYGLRSFSWTRFQGIL